MSYFNPDLERSVIAASMAGSETALAVLAEMEPEHCYGESHRLIFAAIRDQISNEAPVDLLSLTERMREDGTLSKVGGASYLSELSDDFPDLVSATHHAQQIKEMARRRKMKAGCVRCSSMLDDDQPIADVVDDLQYELMSAAEIKRPPITIGESARTVMLNLEALVRGDAVARGLETGLPSLDKVLTGLRPGNIYVVTGPTKSGKSVLAMQIANHCAIHGSTTLFVSLEMSCDELTERQLSASSKVNLNVMRTGEFLEPCIDKIRVAANELQDSRLFIDSTSVTPFDIRSRARLMQIQLELNLIVIDYLQLMEAPGRHENRQSEVQKISRELKRLAKDLKVPILALSQENADGSTRESRALEHDSTAVLQIRRPPGEKEAELHVRLNRHGPTATGDNCLIVDFEGWYSRFVDKGTSK